MCRETYLIVQRLLVWYLKCYIVIFVYHHKPQTIRDRAAIEMGTWLMNCNQAEVELCSSPRKLLSNSTSSTRLREPALRTFVTVAWKVMPLVMVTVTLFSVYQLLIALSEPAMSAGMALLWKRREMLYGQSWV